jgi:hypothetical protein
MLDGAAFFQQRTIRINRAPVLTLWAAVVAERLGFDHDTALTLGRAVAGLNAYSKGVSHVGTALHELEESYFSQYLAYR